MEARESEKKLDGERGEELIDTLEKRDALEIASIE
jgi:hypothetical protein